MPLLRTPLLLLALLAMACAQVFGIQRGYLCDHQESSVETEASHCHSDANGFSPCANVVEDDCCKDKSPARHVPLKGELHARSVLAGTASPSFVAILVAQIPAYEGPFIQFLSVGCVPRGALDTGGDGPPTAVQVARCIVLRV